MQPVWYFAKKAGARLEYVLLLQEMRLYHICIRIFHAFHSNC